MNSTAGHVGEVSNAPRGGDALAAQSPEYLRALIRRAEYRGLTTGLAPGFVQVNLVVLPADWATEFQEFCEANSKACPLLAVSEPGDATLSDLGRDIDVRTDLPRYRVFRNGAAVDEVTELTSLWRNDFVTFALGCSYSFEWALQEAGIPLRHLEIGSKVCVYRTGVDTVATGRFSGKLVVSMRPFCVADAIRAIAVTSRYPAVHGTPIHFGDPKEIGIADIQQPEFGGTPALRDGDVPVFWACGVTPQVVMESARPSIAITHKPGHLLVTDRLNADLAEF